VALELKRAWRSTVRTLKARVALLVRLKAPTIDSAKTRRYLTQELKLLEQHFRSIQTLLRDV
jgi:hypothetical protein